MPRNSIPLVTGEKYHIYNRGTDKRVIFNEKQDYLRFYRSLNLFNTSKPSVNFLHASKQKIYSEDRIVQIHAYCILPNHYHLILEQLQDGGISEFMKRLSVGYTGYFNEKNERKGVLFQGGYKRLLINSDEQFNYLFAYVNENYTIHQIKQVYEMYETSSLHYQRKMTSVLLPPAAQDYNLSINQSLARDIYKRRKDTNKELLEN